MLASSLSEEFNVLFLAFTALNNLHTYPPVQALRMRVETSIIRLREPFQEQPATEFHPLGDKTDSISSGHLEYLEDLFIPEGL